MTNQASSHLQRLLHSASGNGLRAQLMRGSVGSFALKLISIGLSLGVAVVLARVLGPDGFGVFTYVFVLVSFFAVPAKFGLPDLLVRETAKAEQAGDWGLMRGVWRWAGLTAGGISTVIVVVGGLAAWLFAGQLTSLQLTTFAWGLLFVPLLAFGALVGGGLRGLRRVVQGQLPRQLIRPALLIAFVLLFAAFSQTRLAADQAMAFNVLGMAIGFAIGAWLLRRARPAPLAAKPEPRYETKKWFAAILPFALIGGMQIINKQIDIVMLGAMGAAHQVGLYQVAARGGELVVIALVAIRQVTAPYFARFHAGGDMQKLQKLATTVSRATMVLALPAAIAFIFFGKPLIHLVFGAEYVGAYSALAILAGAQLLGAGFGPIGQLLNMSGHENDTAKIMSASAVGNIILNAVLIPLYGINGAALATGFMFVARRVGMWWMVRHRLGVDSSALGLFVLNKPASAS